MRLTRAPFTFFLSLLLLASLNALAQHAVPAGISGFRDAAEQRALDQKFIAVPDPKRAEEHLRTLTAKPHLAGTPEDKATADYVAQKFREAGLETQIVEYKVWLNHPREVSVDVTAPPGVKMHGPTREHVEGDPYQDDARVIPPMNGSSPSGDVEAEVIYANYGRPEDFAKLKELGVDVRGKIVIVRYGANYRGVKVYDAELAGAAGVIIYSDPIDDGYYKGDAYPKGPWRPATGAQRGSVEYMFKYPGDVTTPSLASVPDLPAGQRTPPEKAVALPKIPSTPLSYQDAQPILANLAGPASPREWQGALPFTYHVGPGPVRVKVHLRFDYAYRTIWDVIGVARGTELPEEWVVAGNHRDAWVYGAVDPNSGTAAMLEAVHGIGALLNSGWKPKRTIVFGSWDAEEHGLIGSTEWAEQNERSLANAVAYFNTDSAVSGPKFGASAVPTLKQFIREVTQAVPAAKGPGTVYDVWKAEKEKEGQEKEKKDKGTENTGSPRREPAARGKDVAVGDLGSGSDYTPFFQHLGIPSTDIASNGDYGVYHSVFDNFAWFKKFADPDFTIEQEMARVFGIEVLHMAQADVLPFDYETYGDELTQYLDAAEKKAQSKFGAQAPSFAAARTAAQRFGAAGKATGAAQKDPPADARKLNAALHGAERALLVPEGLPNRPWFKHAIYAPGEFTGYAAVVIPGVNEGIDAGDLARTTKQLETLAGAVNRAAQVLESYR
ncbi:MAG: M28 family metallopeptidase [Acidobacteriota bacterium]|nr:M28 family metallopeptidase [Acidobacteriota bacterium]